jgi:hypothetical protein
MPTLDWIGKKAVVNHHREVPYRLGGGFRFCRLGVPLFDEYGDVAQDVTFPDLAAHIFFSETGVPIRHDDVTKPAARIFISHALEAVMGRKS